MSSKIHGCNTKIRSGLDINLVATSCSLIGQLRMGQDTLHTENIRYSKCIQRLSSPCDGGDLPLILFLQYNIIFGKDITGPVWGSIWQLILEIV